MESLRAKVPQARLCPLSGWNLMRLFRMVSRISSRRRLLVIFSLVSASVM